MQDATHDRQGRLQPQPRADEDHHHQGEYTHNSDGTLNMTPTPDHRIPDHASPTAEQSRVASLAEMHHPDDPAMLAIRHLEQHDREAYDSLSAATRLAYGFWVQGEAAAKGKAS